MDRRIRRFLPALLTLLSVGVVSAGLAWACTPHALLGADSRSGPPGAVVEMRGYTWVPNQTVELRWGGTGGPLLATPVSNADGAFRTPIRVPQEALEETYTIVGLARGRDQFHNKVYRSGMAFTVTSEPARESRNERGANGGNTRAVGGQVHKDTSGGEPTARERGTGPGSRLTVPGGERGDGSTGTGTGTGARTNDTWSSPGAGGARSHTASPAVSGSPEPAASEAATADSGGATAGAGPRVFEGSVAPGGADGSGKPESPTERSATADLWSGFLSEDKTASPLTSDPTGEEARESGSTSALAVGAALLGLGLVALFAGLAVAEARRRRERAAK